MLMMGRYFLKIMPLFASLLMSNLSKAAHKIVADQIFSHLCRQPLNFLFSSRENDDLAAISRSSRPIIGMKAVIWDMVLLLVAVGRG